MINQILQHYQLNLATVKIKPFGNGLINKTWYIETEGNQYILQKVNDTIFNSPEKIASNIKLLGEYLSDQHPDYLFVTALKTNKGNEIIKIENEGYFRLFPFVKDSHTIDVVNSPSQAFEAAQQFGKFTNLLSGFDTNKLNITLPNFHNLSLRFQQFEMALINGNRKRIKESADFINTIQQFMEIVMTWEKIITSSSFKKRVTHHDTKISNVLFDVKEKGLCVIDLDTVMPGYFISDVGDMLRTYLSPVSEEEKDFSLIEIREEYYYAIREGYLSEMGGKLSPIEKEHFFYAGKFMIFMQALRFLTDYFNNDVYYGAKYENHNLIRANNQLTLLQRLVEKEQLFS